MGNMDLASELEILQAQENEGRGVECVRSIVTYLRVGDTESARNVAYNEGDKIRSYPGIVTWLQDNLMGRGYLTFNFFGG